jgi:hypothetical protein
MLQFTDFFLCYLLLDVISSDKLNLKEVIKQYLIESVLIIDLPLYHYDGLYDAAFSPDGN